MKPCDYCGRQAEDDAVHCTGCGSEFEGMVPAAKKLTRSGFWLRALARAIDIAFCMGLALVAGFAGSVLLQILSNGGFIKPGWSHRVGQLSLSLLFYPYIANITYHFLCETVHGATLGKLCCGICVVQADGKPSAPWGVLIRSVAYFVDSLFFGAVAYTSMSKSPLNQRYGDRWGKTAVLKNTEIPPGSKRTTTDLLMGLVLGSLCYIGVIMIGLVIRAS